MMRRASLALLLTASCGDPEAATEAVSAGAGTVAADAAEAAPVAIAGADRLEVALGGDRYVLPATVKRR